MDAINGTNSIYNETPRLIGHKGGLKTSSQEAIYGIFHTDKGVNGEIDEGVFQGNKGDCWLLSGILSLSYTEDGKELIKNAITKNTDGSYEVYFKGINKSYKISEEELKKANSSSFLSGLGLVKPKYSTGDDDMLLIELAVEKIINENEVPIETINGLTGGSAYYLYQLFTDNQVEYAYGDEDSEQDIENFLKYYEIYQEDCAATIGVEKGFKNLEDNHAYAIKSYDDGIMTLVNPWNSTKDVKISEKDLLDNIGSYDISIVDNSIKEYQSWNEEYYA